MRLLDIKKTAGDNGCFHFLHSDLLNVMQLFLPFGFDEMLSFFLSNLNSFSFLHTTWQHMQVPY